MSGYVPLNIWPLAFPKKGHGVIRQHIEASNSGGLGLRLLARGELPTRPPTKHAISVCLLDRV